MTLYKSFLVVFNITGYDGDNNIQKYSQQGVYVVGTCFIASVPSE